MAHLIFVIGLLASALVYIIVHAIVGNAKDEVNYCGLKPHSFLPV